MNLRDLKQEIIKITPKEYKVKTNFSSNDFLIEIGSFVICTKTICTEKEVKYKFVLDTQFISSKELTYEEIVIVKNVIELLNNNKKLAISRLKKWTVGEYLKHEEDRKKKSEEMLEAFKAAIMQSHF